MKIGIMTHHWGRNNYGQYLQHYAMQTWLRAQGHEPFLIDYVPVPKKKSIFYYIKKAVKDPVSFPARVYNKIHARERFRLDEPRYQTFLEFREKHFKISEQHYNSIEELQANPPEADMYITGSDQVWNPFGNTSVLRPFFLDFGDEKVKRVAYAASWGRTKIRENEKDLISPLLKRFQAVSVREDSGIALCNECGFPDSFVAPDPTFLLTPDEWRKLAVPPKENEKYILCYRLSKHNELNYKKLEVFAKENGLKIKYVKGNNFADRHPEVFPSIPEWLGLIDHAEYVITDSFHCSVFAILFQKQFAVLPLRGTDSGMNSRLDTLFKNCEMQPRYLEDCDFSIQDTPYTANLKNLNKLASEILTCITQG